jgi:hypothetical protein
VPLHRPADQTGLQAFVSELRQGVSVQAVAAAILGSNEYLHRA